MSEKSQTPSPYALAGMFLYRFPICGRIRPRLGPFVWRVIGAIHGGPYLSKVGLSRLPTSTLG